MKIVTKFIGKGLPSSDYSYQTMKFDNNNQLYLGGRRTETLGERNNQYIFEDYCVLFKSSDLGRTWNEIKLGSIKGEVYGILNNNDRLVVLNQSVTNDSTFVLKSNDNGKSWNSLFDLSNKYFISDMYQRQNGTIELNARVNKTNQREIFRISKQK